MKKHNIIRYVASGVVLMVAAAMLALPGSGGVSGTSDDDSTVVAAEEPTVVAETEHVWLPGELRDTAAHKREALALQRRNWNSQIKVLARSYGDSIVLRWAPEDYVTWRYLCSKGVNIMRMTDDDEEPDTLVKALKPASFDDFRAAYTDTDSLAMLAMGSLYNKIVPDEQLTHSEAGSPGSLYELQEEQQTLLAVSILASELRRDLADRLAMRLKDSNVKKGRKYVYCIEAAEADSTGRIVVDPCFISLTNERFTPQPLDIDIRDTAQAPMGIRLSWQRRNYSSYEVERRPKGGSTWTRITQRPFMILTPEQDITGECMYDDNPGKPGWYEYRIMAHDPFGDLTLPSSVHEAYLPDLVPPRSPIINRIIIDRPNEKDPSAEIWADIYVKKDTMEADFIGMLPMYYNERLTEGQWKPLVERDRMMKPTDTHIRVDVTNISSGQIVVAALDTAGNVSYSMPQLLRVSDMRPPKAPTGLRAETSVEDGTITLTWNALEDDDINYYEVVYANDSTHTFMTKSKPGLRDTCFVDTVAMDVNQKYIYYKVRAVDFATNIGEYSEMLQVVRPSVVPPSVAHLDSTHVDGNGIFMRWITGTDQQLAYHNVYRKLEGAKRWTLLRRCDADSVKACHNHIDLLDVPEVNSKKEYVYAVESFNVSGISSGLSLEYMVRFTGDPIFSVPIKLYGEYSERTRLTTIAWEADNLPKGKKWYFCIWRKGEGDERFQFLISADADERNFSDRLLRPGQTAQYFIQIQTEDGRESRPSNVVTVKAPEKK